MKKIQSVRGMKDILPSDCKIYRSIENILMSSAIQFGYKEIRTPLLEDSELFIKSIGDGTDIVDKEMYTFVGSKGNSYSMRPEGTASCVRAIIESGSSNTINKLWYCGPFFRHERPQKGRYRQFHQFGVEFTGVESYEADIEIILLTKYMWEKLKINPKLKINTIGDSEDRKKYTKNLIQYLAKYEKYFEDDDKQKIKKNPLRILDSKKESIKNILIDAPKISNYISKGSALHFEKFVDGLIKNDINYEIDLHLVRGLDYYNRTVFEYIDNTENTQNTICAGGRYDFLFENIFNKKVPALGFAIGIDRLIEFLNYDINYNENIKFYVAVLREEDFAYAQKISGEIRKYSDNFSILVDYSCSNLKAQLKKANKLEANYCIIIGENEAAGDSIQIKNMNSSEQDTIVLNEIGDYIKTKFVL